MMPALPDIRNLSLGEIEKFLKEQGEPSYRAKQIFTWIYQKNAVRFPAMTTLSRALRERLEAHFSLYPPEMVTRQRSKDGTGKFLFRMDDGETIETVLIPTAKRATLCISSQAGCKFGCRFCASGVGGLARPLTTAEIVGQVLAVRTLQPGHPVTHVVFMGTGEPLDNYDAVMKAVRVMNDPSGLNIGARRITISTCGLVPGILRLAEEGLQLELSVSLHGADDAARQQLMPVNRKYPLAELIAACRTYAGRTNRQITFEYLLIEGLTCTPRAADQLAKMLKGLLCKLNLIAYNPVPEFPFRPPAREAVRSFHGLLERNGLHATVRAPRGKDITAACGQLRHSRGQPSP